MTRVQTQLAQRINLVARNWFLKPVEIERTNLICDLECQGKIEALVTIDQQLDIIANDFARFFQSLYTDSSVSRDALFVHPPPVHLVERSALYCAKSGIHSSARSIGKTLQTAITGTATVTAEVIELASIAGAITGTATVVLASLIRKVPQPELELTVTNVTGSPSDEENAQDTLELLVGV